MLFLIEYDRRTGLLVNLTRYTDTQSSEANAARLELELALERARLTHEVVLLEAASEEDLRRSHGRYFKNFEQLVQRSEDSSENP